MHIRLVDAASPSITTTSTSRLRGAFRHRPKQQLRLALASDTSGQIFLVRRIELLSEAHRAAPATPRSFARRLSARQGRDSVRHPSITGCVAGDRHPRRAAPGACTAMPAQEVSSLLTDSLSGRASPRRSRRRRVRSPIAGSHMQVRWAAGAFRIARRFQPARTGPSAHLSSRQGRRNEATMPSPLYRARHESAPSEVNRVRSRVDIDPHHHLAQLFGSNWAASAVDSTIADQQRSTVAAPASACDRTAELAPEFCSLRRLEQLVVGPTSASGEARAGSLSRASRPSVRSGSTSLSIPIGEQGPIGQPALKHARRHAFHEWQSPTPTVRPCLLRCGCLLFFVTH